MRKHPKILVNDSSADSDQSEPAYKLTNQNIPKNGKKKNFRHKNRFRWTFEQDELYINFLIQNIQIFNSPMLRKAKKVYSDLSGRMKSRTTSQVKSHHQKMMEHYKSPANIIINLGRKRNIGPVKSTKDLQNKSTRDFQQQTDPVDSDIEPIDNQPLVCPLLFSQQDYVIPYQNNSSSSDSSEKWFQEP